LSKNKKPPRVRLRQVQTKTAQSLISSLALVSLVPRLKSEARVTNARAWNYWARYFFIHIF